MKWLVLLRQTQTWFWMAVAVWLICRLVYLVNGCEISRPSAVLAGTEYAPQCAAAIIKR